MWNKLARTTLCLGVSAAALITVMNLDATAGDRRRGSVPEAAEPKPAPPNPAPPKVAPPTAPKPKTANLTTLAPAATATVSSTAPTRRDDRAAVTLPDWKGKRLSVARREARKLGLNVTAVDESGEAVPAELASEYRVRRQLTKAGSDVEPGTGVEVRVREIADTAMGY